MTPPGESRISMARVLGEPDLAEGYGSTKLTHLRQSPARPKQPTSGHRAKHSDASILGAPDS